MRPAAVVVVAAVVVLAGCSFGPAEGGPTPGASTPLPTTATSTAADDAHPWADEVVVVAVNDSAAGPRSFVPLVRAALSAWNGTAVTGGTVRFVVAPDAPDPDLVVTVQPRVPRCGGETAADSFSYCVPRLVRGPIEEPVRAQVSGRYENDTFVVIARGGFANLLDRAPERAAGYPPETVRYVNPWPFTDPVVVNVTNEANGSRSFAPLVRAAVDWWAARPATERNYTANFVVRPDAPRADVQVRLVREIEACGIESHEEILGCADVLNTRTLARDNVTVRIEAGYTDASTLATLKHEFGHLYGRRHGQAPLPVMNETQASATLWPKPNATDRAFAWNRSTLTVFVAANGSVDADDAWADVEPAFRYYEDGADGWLAQPVRFERTADRSSADIVVRVTDEPVCGFAHGGVCDIEIDGENLDSDPAYERYTAETFVVTTTGRTSRAWMTAFAVGFVLGASAPEELPPPLQDNSEADEEWWR